MSTEVRCHGAPCKRLVVSAYPKLCLTSCRNCTLTKVLEEWWADFKKKKILPAFGSLPPLCPAFNAELFGKKMQSLLFALWWTGRRINCTRLNSNECDEGSIECKREKRIRGMKGDNEVIIGMRAIEAINHQLKDGKERKVQNFFPT